MLTDNKNAAIGEGIPRHKKFDPNMSSYTQQYLPDSLLQCSYNAHDAIEDVLILQKL